MSEARRRARGSLAVAVIVCAWSGACSPGPRPASVVGGSDPTPDPAGEPAAPPEPPSLPVEPVAVSLPAPPSAVVAPGPLAVDAGFGDGGRRVFRREPGEHELKAVALVGDSILAVGHARFGGVSDACVARFDATGALDSSFGQGGVARVGAQGAFGTQLAIDAQGRILVAGYFYGPGQAENLLLGRLSPDGVLDPGFGTGGLAALDLGRADDRPSGVLPLPSGGVLVVGIHSVAGGGDYETYVLRFDEHGRVDRTFGRGGVQTADPLPGREFGTRALLDRDGSIVVGGYRVSPEQGGFVARLTAGGTLDPRFGDGGVVVMREIETAWALALDERGRILLGGHTANGRAVVARLTRDGRLDPEWTGAGAGPAGSDDQLYGLVPGADGTVVGAGFRGLAERARPLVLRWGPSGALDTSMGSGGAVLGARGDLVLQAAVDARGGLVGVGMTVRGDEIAGLVTRFARQ